MPTREQRELPTDIQVTVAKYILCCLGIYATVSSPGAIGVGDEIVGTPACLVIPSYGHDPSLRAQPEARRPPRGQRDDAEGVGGP